MDNAPKQIQQQPPQIDLKAIKKQLGIEEKPFDLEDFSRIIGQGITSEYKQMKNTIHKDWDAFDRDARDLKLPKNRPYLGCANHSVSVTSSNMDGIVPREIEDLFDYNEPIEFQILDDTDEDKSIAISGNKLMSWDIEGHEDLREEIWYFIENANKFGISFAYTFWEEEKDWDWIEEQVIVMPNGQTMPYSDQIIVQHQKMQQVAAAAQAQGQQVPPLPDLQVTVNSKKVYQWVKYNPKTICLDNYKVCWNSDATSLDDAFKNGFVAIQIDKTLDEIFKIMLDNPNQALFQNLIELRNALNKSKTLDNKNINAQWKTKKIPFWLFWTKADVNNDDIEEQVCGLMFCDENSSYTKNIGLELYALDHKECPIVGGRIKPLHKKVNGIGIPEMLFADKQYLDTLRNQMDDFRRLYAIPRRLYDEQSGFNPAIHKYELGANWPLNQGFQNHMEIEQITPYTQDHWKEFETVLNMCNQRIGSSQIEKGAMPDQNMTFRGMIQLLEESSKTRSMFKRWLGQSIQKIFYHRFRLYQQYWGREARKDQQVQNWISQILRGTINTEMPINEEILTVLDHNCNLILKATNEDKKLNELKARDEFELLLPYLQQPGFEVELNQAYVELLRAMGSKNPTSKVPDLQKVMQRQMEIQKQAMEQMYQEQVQHQEQQRQEDVKKEEFIRHDERLRIQNGIEQAAGVHPEIKNNENKTKKT
jgi:hypothetical protein